MSRKKEMAGDYEILQSIKLGGRMLLLGHNPKDSQAPYMTCYQRVNILGEDVYPEAVASADYFEIMQLFIERLQAQKEVVEQFRAGRNAPFQLLGKEHCRKREDGESLEGKLIILSPASLSPEYRTADCQLGIATGGYGCEARANGRAVYFMELYSGERCRWNVGDVLGIADTDKLPDWAKEKLAAYREKESLHKKKKSSKERGEER